MITRHDMHDRADLKVWFREDIQRILLGINAASLSSGNHQHDGYRTGFVAALCSVALTIGIEPKSLMLPGEDWSTDVSAR